MSDSVLTATKVFIGAFDVTGQLNSVALDVAVELLDATDFASGGVRELLPGLRTVALQIEGHVDASTIDAALFDGIGLYAVPVSVVGDGTVGSAADFFLAALADYSPGGAVGELMRFSAGAESSGGKLVRGTLMINIAAAAVSGAGTPLELGAVGATQSMFAALHVFAASAGDTLDVIIESDSAVGMATPITRITFAQIAGGIAAAEWKSTAGAITDTWWRVSYVIAGNGAEAFSFAVALGIGPTV